MSHTTEILLGLFVVFVAAQIGAEIAQRLKLPAVVGEIAAGCIVGPSVLGWVHVNEPLEVLAEIGAVLTESFQIVPEQSTAAIVVHHPQASYFSIGGSARERAEEDTAAVAG